MTVSEASKSHSNVIGRPLLWLNVLCLDAALVAITWQWMFAHAFHLTLEPAERLALFLTAWWIYLLDRFADSVALPPTAIRSARTDFCLRHRHRRAVLLVIVGFLDGITILKGLEQQIILWGFFLGAIAFLYLAINYSFSRVWQTMPFKEIAVGFLFATGVVMVPLLRTGQAASGLLLTAFLFGSLCSLNCLSIAVWERELDEKQGKHSFATRYPGAGFHVRLVCMIVALTSLVFSFVSPNLWPLTASLALSGVLLFALHFGPLARDERTALADLVLLTPLFLLIAERLR